MDEDKDKATMIQEEVKAASANAMKGIEFHCLVSLAEWFSSRGSRIETCSDSLHLER